MDWPRAKTLLICLLLAINAVLGGIWAARALSADARDKQADRTLRQLLTEKGLDAGDVPIPSDTALRYDLRRDTAGEKALAEAVLGPVTLLEGSTAAYEGEGGRADFRASGRFEIALSAPVAVSDTSLASLIQKMGLTDNRPDAEGSDRRQSAVTQYIEGLPVRNCLISFEISDGLLTAVRGQWLSGRALPVSPEPCFSAGYCLLALAGEFPPGAGRTLVSCRLAFLSAPVASDVERLTPMWIFALSDGVYYMSAMTGARLDMQP